MGTNRAVIRVAMLASLGLVACRDGDRLQSIPTEEPLPASTRPVPTPSTLPPIGNNVPPQIPIPEDLDHTPTETPDGVPAPMANVYTDKGVAPAEQPIRGLISFPIRNEAALEEELRELYDPSSSRFRQYLSVETWMERYAPRLEDVQLVSSWLQNAGFQVERVSANRLLLHFTCSVGQFNDAFGVELHIFDRKSPQGGNPDHEVMGLLTSLNTPKFIEERIHAVVALDLPTHPGTLPGEGAGVGPPPPEVQALTPEQIAAAYDFDDLYAQGFRGQGVRLGVTIGASFRFKDVRGFWEHMGITRTDPVIVETMEPPATRYREGTLDVQWAGAMAPEAELVVYMGPDARNTSMIYTFNEAIAQNSVDVITDSFAHREDSEARSVHEAYAHASMMAAALGITVVAAGGDSAGVDTPGSSPWVTSVGGTDLVMDGTALVRETTWPESGSGYSRTFDRPWWQASLPGDFQKRAVADVALNSGSNYHFVFLGSWWGNYGTSFASPVFAGMIATVNSARASEGKPRVGWLNAHLYTLPQVQATFRDITDGASWNYPSGIGWDVPTGWGAPSAAGLRNTLP